MTARCASFLILAVLAIGCGGSPSAPSGPAVLSLTVTSENGGAATTFSNDPALSAQVTLNMSATAQFSDGTSRVVTSDSSWTSTNTAVASTAGAAVTVNRHVTGSAIITATFQGTSGHYQIFVAAQ